MLAWPLPKPEVSDHAALDDTTFTSWWRACPLSLYSDPTRRREGSVILSSIREILKAIAPRPDAEASSSDKKNYAEKMSREIATKVANGLRPSFPDILPGPEGQGQESRARTSKGFKRLDVNYSTLELGLGLGVSIKTINFRDRKTKRYTKNYSRVDNELRAEATDYHQRQPYSVLAGVLFLPVDACDDGREQAANPSSFGAAVRYFRNRADRRTSKDETDLFEGFFIGLYEPEGSESEGDVTFFDVMKPPPRHGRPPAGMLLSFDGLIDEIRRLYDDRNDPPFEWLAEQEAPDGSVDE